MGSKMNSESVSKAFKLIDRRGYGFYHRAGHIPWYGIYLGMYQGVYYYIYTLGEKLDLKFTPPVITISNSIRIYIH